MIRMIQDPRAAHLVYWSQSGESFLFYDSKAFVSEILVLHFPPFGTPLFWFTDELVELKHPKFLRDYPERLLEITQDGESIQHEIGLTLMPQKLPAKAASPINPATSSSQSRLAISNSITGSFPKNTNSQVPEGAARPYALFQQSQNHDDAHKLSVFRRVLKSLRWPKINRSLKQSLNGNSRSLGPVSTSYQGSHNLAVVGPEELCSTSLDTETQVGYKKYVQAAQATPRQVLPPSVSELGTQGSHAQGLFPDVTSQRCSKDIGREYNDFNRNSFLYK
ncbi:hypothetical protein FRC03_009829 [Tulasnella sp. 419]|nr:hypothetical protein FRC03_009829 [Tulasnella sp. 419]